MSHRIENIMKTTILKRKSNYKIFQYYLYHMQNLNSDSWGAGGKQGESFRLHYTYYAQLDEFVFFATSFPALLRNSFLMQFHAVNTHASALAQTVAKTTTKTNTNTNTNTRPIPIPESTAAAATTATASAATGYDDKRCVAVAAQSQSQLALPSPSQWLWHWHWLWLWLWQTPPSRAAAARVLKEW